MELELPYPPSINHYYRHVGPRVLISRDGRKYRERVVNILKANGVKPLDGPLRMTIEIYPPDKRRRDIDNTQKSLWDSLQHGGAYHDDSQIVRFEVIKREALPPDGMVFVRLSPCS